MSKLAVLQKYGYSLVTSADKFWDLISWTAFALMVQSATAFLFLVGWSVVQTNKAQQRHWRYIAEYRFSYPQERKTLIPYLI